MMGWIIGKSIQKLAKLPFKNAGKIKIFLDKGKEFMTYTPSLQILL